MVRFISNGVGHFTPPAKTRRCNARRVIDCLLAAMRNVAWLSGLFLAFAGRAQHVFVVVEDGRPEVVRDVRYGRAQIEVDGKLRGSDGTQFALRDAAIYGPGLITVLDFQVRSHHLEVDGGPSRLNFELEIRGQFESESDLGKCFMVLDVTSGRNKGVVFGEMPNLEGGKAQHVEILLPLKAPLERGSYQVHYFSGGFEILHSKMPAAYIEEQKHRTTDFLSRPSDRSLKLIHAVKPAYPDELVESNAAGSAKVRCLIDAEGAVAEATLIECSHPAFGESALAAVREWRFEPAIKNHEPVATTADIPFEFKPPVQPAAANSSDAPAPVP